MIIPKERYKKSRKIGNTMDDEISFKDEVKKKFEKVNVYADTETFLFIPEGIEPWKLDVTSREYTKALSECTNIPWLLVWSYQPRNLRNNKTESYENSGWVTETDIYHNGFREFFETLRSLYAHKKIPVIWFHNASFDLTAIISQWKTFLDPDLVVYYYARDNNKNFLRGAMESPKFKFKALLGDTMLFEIKSIESMGESLGKPKGKDVPYTMANISIEWPTIHYLDYKDGIEKTFNIVEYMEYAKRDVEIQQEYTEQLNAKKDRIYRTIINDDELYKKKRSKLKGLTQGSLAKELTNVYLEQNRFPSGVDGHFRVPLDKEKPELINAILKSNMGGYTTSNKNVRYYSCVRDDNGELSEKLSVFDCNSEYPFVLTNSIPWGTLLDTPPDNPDYTTWYLVSFKKCSWKPPMDCLKYGPIANERINDHEPVKFYMLKEYYDMLERLCDIDCTIHSKGYQENTTIFRPFIQRLYKLRNESKVKMKELGKDHEDYIKYEHDQHGCKIIMNSIYGKLCEAPHEHTCFYYKDKYVKYKNEDTIPRSILSGSFITYSGRLLLIDKIERCIRAGFKVLYSDTDSVMFVHPVDADLKLIFGEETGQLGEWKNEGSFNLFFNSGVKKKYCLLDTDNPTNYKIAWSGINKAVPKIFKSALNQGSRQAIEDLKTIFSPTENILFRHQKRSRVLNQKYHQKIIYDTNFQMNKAIGKPTGECIIENGTYKLIKYGS